jgi:hypothetical protein
MNLLLDPDRGAIDRQPFLARQERRVKEGKVWEERRKKNEVQKNDCNRQSTKREAANDCGVGGGFLRRATVGLDLMTGRSEGIINWTFSLAMKTSRGGSRLKLRSTLLPFWASLQHEFLHLIRRLYLFLSWPHLIIFIF